MSFAQILGQKSAVTILRNALSRGRLAHAYLFLGPEGVGKRLTALALAKAMNCQAPSADGDACEQCPSCTKINSAQHADVVLIEPEGEFIKIDQIRALQKQLQFRPLEKGHRACILDPAEQMNKEASNALLKTLEEPPKDTHLFLITARPHHLLPTILSRCQWVKFKPLSGSQVVEILRRNASLDAEQAPFLASLAAGSAGKAFSLSGQVDFQKRLEWLRVFSELSGKTAEEIFETCERMAKGEEEIDDLLEFWKLWIRDLLVFKVRGKAETLINRGLEEQVAADASKYDLERLDFLFTFISDVQRGLALKVNRQLALETLMLGMKKEEWRDWQPLPPFNRVPWLG